MFSLTTKRDLSKWQDLRDNCKACIETKDKGLWCSINNFKCSFTNCNSPNKNTNTPPLISDGLTTPNVVTSQKGGVNSQQGLTLRQQEALSLSLKKPKLSYEKIGEQLGVSKVAAYKLIIKAKQKMGLTLNAPRLTKLQNRGLTLVSLHNDSISIIVHSVLAEIPGKLITLKNSKYVLRKDEDTVLKIFENKTVIQFRKELQGDNIEDLKTLADQRIKDYLIKEYSKMEYKQLSRHYALMGTEIAKKYVREGRKLIIYDKLDGKERLLVDLSETAQDKLHLEAPHTVKGYNDGDKVKSMLDDIINRPSYLPSQTKDILDTILGVQQRYAEQIELHLKVLTKMDKSLNKIARGYNEKSIVQRSNKQSKLNRVAAKGRKHK